MSAIKAAAIALTVAASGAVALAGIASPAFAVGSGGNGGGGGGGGGSGGGSSGGSGGQDGSGGGSSRTDTPITCNAGWVLSSNKQYCVRAQSHLDQGLLYRQGEQAAIAGDYGQALALLKAADQADPMVLTMIGYSKRKLGAVDEGIGYYHRALAIDPGNLNTREYLGEGYVAMGRLDLAQRQLDMIGAIGGEDCDQYLQLASAMAGGDGWPRAPEIAD